MAVPYSPLFKDQGQTPTETEIPSHEEHQQMPPRTLKESAPSWFWRVGASTLFIAIPMAYIVLVGMVAYLDKKEQSLFGDNVLEVLQVASTLWPISFAAVAGPCFKTLALHRAERGSSLATLEFLLTSQTTTAAFKSLFTIKHIRVWTIGIALVWCLSPLGGQAAVRSLQLRPNSTTTEVPAMYYLGSNISDFNYFFGGGDICVFLGASTYASLISSFRSVVLSSFSMPDTIISHENGSTDGFESAVESLGGAFQAARLGRRDPWHNV